VFIYTFGLVDGTAPWDGKVHREINTYVRWRLGAFWLALWIPDLVIGAIIGVHLMKIVGDTFWTVLKGILRRVFNKIYPNLCLYPPSSYAINILPEESIRGSEGRIVR
jgi:hypothetical protein